MLSSVPYQHCRSTATCAAGLELQYLSVFLLGLKKLKTWDNRKGPKAFTAGHSMSSQGSFSTRRDGFTSLNLKHLFIQATNTEGLLQHVLQP